MVRKAQVSSDGEYIAEEAPHWRPEPYLPVYPNDWSRALVRHREMDSARRLLFLDHCRQIATTVDRQYAGVRQSLAERFAVLDPDRDTRQLSPLPECRPAERVPEIRTALLSLLDAAGYTPLSRRELESCIGLSSDWGVKLKIDLDVFEHLMLYTRGDVVAVRVRRRMRNAWRREEVEVPIYQRLFAMFSLSDPKHDNESEEEGKLHLRMFKNIPKLDVDMLLPAGDVHVSWLDRFRILVPTVGGMGVTVAKIVRGVLILAFAGLTGTAMLVLLVIVALAYPVRSLFSYNQTKRKYLLDLTKSLYYQKLDANTGVMTRLIEEATRQETNETILAYFAIFTSNRSLSRRGLRRRCERIVRESLGIEIRGRFEAATSRLEGLGLIQRDATQRLIARDGALSASELE